MNSTGRVRPWQVIAILGTTILALCAIEVTGYFRLSSETSALRASLMKSSPAGWNKKIALHFGWLTTALVRTGLRFAHLESEPRAALESVRAVEFGVYNSAHSRGGVSGSAVLAAADKAMSARGWERMVAVCNEHEFVVIYVPHQRVSSSNLHCCLGVVNGDTLVVGSVKGDPTPLLEIARKHLPHAKVAKVAKVEGILTANFR